MCVEKNSELSNCIKKHPVAISVRMNVGSETMSSDAFMHKNKKYSTKLLWTHYSSLTKIETQADVGIIKPMKKVESDEKIDDCTELS